MNSVVIKGNKIIKINKSTCVTLPIENLIFTISSSDICKGI